MLNRIYLLRLQAVDTVAVTVVSRPLVASRVDTPLRASPVTLPVVRVDTVARVNPATLPRVDTNSRVPADTVSRLLTAVSSSNLVATFS